MSAIHQVSRPASNRRNRVRQKVHVPAYATFSSASGGEMLSLYEVLDISENGVALQCSLPIKINQIMELCLDLAETGARISASGRVVWFNPAGQVGLSLPALPDSATRRLREWLFLNALAAAANAAASPDSVRVGQRQNYTDLLNAAQVVQRQAESLGPDLEAVLSLVVSRARSLLRASGAAIALERPDPSGDNRKSQKGRNSANLSAQDRSGEVRCREMICRASAGLSAPPVGASLQVGSGFSGECVRTGKLLRCDDTEVDQRVERQSCRALGIRSILAAPVRKDAVGKDNKDGEEETIGLLEVFATRPGAFAESDGELLQRLADTIATAVDLTTRIAAPAASSDPPIFPKSYSPPGSILFAHPPADKASKRAGEADEKSKGEREHNGKKNGVPAEHDNLGGIRLPRAQLYLLMAVAVTIALVLGFVSAPWIQPRVQPWIEQKLHSGQRSGEQTVLASSNSPTGGSTRAQTNTLTSVSLSTDADNLPKLREMASGGNAAAENAMGLLYAAGDDAQGIRRDEKESARWFAKAAEHGSVPAQSKLGSLYWGGRGLPKDDEKAYFWTLLARASGDEASKALAPFIATRLTIAQRTMIEQQADAWVQQHELATDAQSTSH